MAHPDRHRPRDRDPGTLATNIWIFTKGKMRYARNHRPLIAPVGYEVLDRGDQSWLFPGVSSRAAGGSPFGNTAAVDSMAFIVGA